MLKNGTFDEGLLEKLKRNKEGNPPYFSSC